MKLASITAIGLCVSFTANVFAGTITGNVKAEGKPEVEAAATGGKYDSRKYKFVERVNYGELRDFVIYIDGPVSGVTNAPETLRVETRRVQQQGATFVPHVLPVMAGTTVEWPNKDEIFHNVFSMSETKPFDLELYKGNPKDKRVTFDKAGRVDVFCSIHANMNCVVLVVENPFFAVTDDTRRYTIPNVPAGTYKLKAWHERLPAQTQEVTVPTNGEVKVNFTLGIKNLPKI